MKTIGLLAALLAFAGIIGCSSNTEQKVATSDTVAVQTDIDRISGDKHLIVDVMKRSLDKGTLDDAIDLAMEDSVFASQVISTIAADPNLAGRFDLSTGGKTAATHGAATHLSAGKHVAASGNQGDALDKAERTGSQVNAKLDQAARVKQQAVDAKHKIDGIFRP